MKQFRCPHCGQSTFSTLCTDCLAEGIRIQEVRSIFHVGRCHRCGHMDDEPCAARIGANRAIARAWQQGAKALKQFGHLAGKLATRAAESMRGGPTSAS